VDGSGADPKVRQRNVGTTAKVILDSGFRERKRVNDNSALQVLNSFSDNLKAARRTKIQKRPRGLKWAGLIVLLLGWASVAAAQPMKKSSPDWPALRRPCFSAATYYWGI
jgi:hypothetical protein